jgi:hypothetical protein
LGRAARRDPCELAPQGTAESAQAEECAAATEVALTLNLVPRDEAQRVLVLAARVAAMLTRLIQRFQ